MFRLLPSSLFCLWLLLLGGKIPAHAQTGLPVVSAGAVRSQEGHSATTGVRLPVYLSAAAAEPVTVTWTTVDGTAAAGSDFTAGGGTVTFAPGEVMQIITVDLTGDTAAEEDEFFLVTLSAPAGATLGESTGRVLICDDEALTAILLPQPANLPEMAPGNTSMPLYSVLNPVDGRTASFALISGTAQAGQDATLTDPAVAMTTGERALPVSLLDDAELEDREEIFVKLQGLGPRVKASPSHPVQVLPAMKAPVSMALEDHLLVTADGLHLKIFRRTNGVWAQEADLDGSGEGGVNSVAVHSGLIAAVYPSTGIKIFREQEGTWVLEKTLTLPAPGASLPRPLRLQDDSLVVGLPAAVPGQTGSISGSVRIYERNWQGHRAWGERQVLTPAGGIQADFGSFLSLWGNSLAVGAPGAYAVSVFQRNPEARTWGLSREFCRFVRNFGRSLALNGDSLVCHDQQGVTTSRISPAGGGTWGDLTANPLNILSGDLQPVLAGNILSGRLTDNNYRFWYQTSQGAWAFLGDLRPPLPTPAVPGRMVFDGQTAVVSAGGDPDSMTLHVYSGSSVKLSIVDNEGLTCTISNGTVSPGLNRVKFTLSKPLPFPYSVQVEAIDGTAVSGSDYVLPATTNVSFSSGSTEQYLTLAVYPPEAGEVQESFKLRMVPTIPGTAGPDATITIVPDPPTLGFTTTSLFTSEGQAGKTTVLIPWQLNGPAPEGASFTWSLEEETAEAGTDFEAASGTVTLPAGATSGSFPILINGDLEGEWEERLRVWITSGDTIVIQPSFSFCLVYIGNDDSGIAVGDTFVLAQGSTFTGPDIRANDVGITQVQLVESPAHGTLTLYSSGSNAGTFIYRPSPNFSGTDRFTYQDSFSRPEQPPVVAQVVLQVTDGLIPPVLRSDTFITNEDTPVDQTGSAAIPQLLVNDGLFDPGGIPYSPVLEMELSGAFNGVLSGHEAGNGRFKFTPAPEFSGSAGFYYRVRDKDGWSQPALVSITVRNDLPLPPFERLQPAGSQLFRSSTAAFSLPANTLVDCFLELKAGQTFSVRDTATQILGRLELQDVLGQAVPGGVASPNALEHIPITADGTYRLVAGNRPSNANSTIKCVINGGVPLNPTTVALAYSLDAARPPGSPRAAVAVQMAAGLPHYYTFTGQAGEEVEIFLQSTLVQTFNLHQTSGTLLGASAPSPHDAKSAVLRRILPADGTYRIYVGTPVSPPGSCEFSLQLFRPGQTHEYSGTTLPAKPALARLNAGFLKGPGVLPTVNPGPVITFAAFADYGSGSPNLTAVATMVKAWNPDFLIAAGDHNYALDYKIGTASWTTNVGNFYGSYIKGRNDNRYPEQTSPVQRYFTVPGNHDTGPDPANGGELSSYFEYFHSNPGGLPRLPQGVHQPNLSYYKFSWGNCDFFCLDSDNAAVSSTALQEQRQWLKEQVSLSTAKWKFGVWHHPPYSSSAVHGDHSFIQWGADFAGLTAIITGHDHIYERIKLPLGPTQFIVGNAGNSLYSLKSVPTAGSVFRNNTHHGALKVTAGTEGIQFAFFAAGPGGGIPLDSLTIGQSPVPETPAGTDQWSLRVQPGQSWRLSTRTPPVPGGLDHGVDPRLEVLDAAGNLVASDSNHAAGGLNASVDFTVPDLPGAPPEGVLWTVKVINEASGQGEYEILAGPSPLPQYEAWAAGHFGALPPGADAVGADPDGDGFPNLMEFLLDSPPLGPSSQLPLVPVLESGAEGKFLIQLPAQWTRPVTARIQRSTDLQQNTWQDVAVKTPQGSWQTTLPGISLPSPAAGGGYHYTPPPSPALRQFHRLSFQLE